METYTSVKFRNVPPSLWHLAARVLQACAHTIQQEGIRKGIIYSVEGNTWILYKTKTSFVIYVEQPDENRRS
jgi:hypothetical protein